MTEDTKFKCYRVWTEDCHATLVHAENEAEAKELGSKLLSADIVEVDDLTTNDEQ